VSPAGNTRKHSNIIAWLQRFFLAQHKLNQRLVDFAPDVAAKFQSFNRDA
jgi:hypothetical protein